MKRYKVILRMGHCGSGKYYEITRYIKAKNACEALEKASKFGGTKKGKNIRGVVSIQEVNHERFVCINN